MDLPWQTYRPYVKRGSILHSRMFEDIGCDHGKFFVIMGVSATYVVGFFFINTDIHRAILSRPDQLAMQCPIKATDYPFLDYMSYINGASLIKRPIDEICRSLAEGRGRIVGELLPDDLELLLERARESRLFSRAEKRDFLE